MSDAFKYVTGQKIKLLLAMPSPRNIPQVIAEWKNLIDDQLYVKHYKEHSAYQIIRDFFLSNDYTHLAICPDDLIVTQKDVDILKRDIEKFNYPVISGVCGVDEDENRPVAVMISNIPSRKRKGRSFPYIKFEELDEITKVLFSGFPLMIIRRDVVRKIDFECDEGGGFIDVMFCNNCFDNQIPIYVDRRAKMIHLRKLGKEINIESSSRKILFKNGDMLQVLQRPCWD